MKGAAIVGMALVLCAGCGSDGTSGNRSNLTLSLTQYGVHSGQRIEVKVKTPTGSQTLGSASGTVPQNGTTSLTVANVVEPSGSYRVDWYVDVDGNGSYTAPSGGNFIDHAWRREVNGNASGVTVSHVHDTNWTDIAPF
jgi:hypothetical protein